MCCQNWGCLNPYPLSPFLTRQNQNVARIANQAEKKPKTDKVKPIQCANKMDISGKRAHFHGNR